MEQGMKATGKWRSARLKINQKREDMSRKVDLQQLLISPLKWVHLERFICFRGIFLQLITTQLIGNFCGDHERMDTRNS